MKRKAAVFALAMCVVSAHAALAQSDIGFKRLGVAAGLVNPDGFGSTFGIGVFADLGTITPQIGLETRVDYWSASEEAFGTEASVRDIAVGARGKYNFEIANSRIRPFAGAGLSLHFAEAELTVTQPGFPPMTADDSSIELGIDMGGGMTMPVNPRSEFLAELWYVAGDLDHLTIRAGVSWKLGN